MKRLLILRAASTLLAAGWLAGCGSNDSKPAPVQPIAENSYAAAYKAVLEPNCRSCHGLAGALDVDQYNALLTKKDLVRELVLNKKSMPPKTQLTTAQLDLMRAWLDAGAPQGGTKPEIQPKPQPVALAANFESIRQNILVPKCQICHAKLARKDKLPLETYEQVMKFVTAGDADHSDLVEVLLRTDARTRMPPARSKLDALSAEEVGAVKQWIQAGAKP